MLPRFILGLLGALLVSTSALAQKINVPAGTLTAGNEIVISFEDASKAGTTITVTITNEGYPTPQVQYVEIVLDASGKGSAGWTVPTGWWMAFFNAPDATEQARTVQ
jgi:hypothetical protein